MQEIGSDDRREVGRNHTGSTSAVGCQDQGAAIAECGLEVVAVGARHPRGAKALVPRGGRIPGGSISLLWAPDLHPIGRWPGIHDQGGPGVARLPTSRTRGERLAAGGQPEGHTSVDLLTFKMAQTTEADQLAGNQWRQA